MNIGDPAIGGGDSVAIGDMVTSQEQLNSLNIDLIVKREKPKRPPPPVIMSELRVSYIHFHFESGVLALGQLNGVISKEVLWHFAISW